MKPKEPMKDDLLEKLAELEHKQWQSWAKIRCPEHILIDVPYSKLSEENKEKDRVWARKVIKIINKSTSPPDAAEKAIEEFKEELEKGGVIGKVQSLKEINHGVKLEQAARNLFEAARQSGMNDATVFHENVFMEGRQSALAEINLLRNCNNALREAVENALKKLAKKDKEKQEQVRKLLFGFKSISQERNISFRKFVYEIFPDCADTCEENKFCAKHGVTHIKYDCAEQEEKKEAKL